jgi:collagen type IV alpha
VHTPPVPGTPVPGGQSVGSIPHPGLIPEIPGGSQAFDSVSTPAGVLLPSLGTVTSSFLPTPGWDLPAVPGLSIPLPGHVGLPTDLLCAGTGWSLPKQDNGAHPADGLILPIEQQPRRGDW